MKKSKLFKVYLLLLPDLTSEQDLTSSDGTGDVLGLLFGQRDKTTSCNTKFKYSLFI